MEWRQIESRLCDYFRMEGYIIEAGGGDTLAYADPSENDTEINITELARHLAWEMADAA